MPEFSMRSRSSSKSRKRRWTRSERSHTSSLAGSRRTSPTWSTRWPGPGGGGLGGARRKTARTRATSSPDGAGARCNRRRRRRGPGSPDPRRWGRSRARGNRGPRPTAFGKTTSRRLRSARPPPLRRLVFRPRPRGRAGVPCHHDLEARALQVGGYGAHPEGMSDLHGRLHFGVGHPRRAGPWRAQRRVAPPRLRRRARPKPQFRGHFHSVGCGVDRQAKSR